MDAQRLGTVLKCSIIFFARCRVIVQSTLVWFMGCWLVHVHAEDADVMDSENHGLCNDRPLHSVCKQQARWQTNSCCNLAAAPTQPHEATWHCMQVLTMYYVLQAKESHTCQRNAQDVHANNGRGSYT